MISSKLLFIHTNIKNFNIIINSLKNNVNYILFNENDSIYTIIYKIKKYNIHYITDIGLIKVTVTLEPEIVTDVTWLLS